MFVLDPQEADVGIGAVNTAPTQDTAGVQEVIIVQWVVVLVVLYQCMVTVGQVEADSTATVPLPHVKLQACLVRLWDTED